MEGGSQLICILTEVYKPGLWVCRLRSKFKNLGFQGGDLFVPEFIDWGTLYVQRITEQHAPNQRCHHVNTLPALPPHQHFYQHCYVLSYFLCRVASRKVSMGFLRERDFSQDQPCETRLLARLESRMFSRDQPCETRVSRDYRRVSHGLVEVSQSLASGWS